MELNNVWFYCVILFLVLFEVFLFSNLNKKLKLNFFLRTLFFFIVYCFQTGALILFLHFSWGKHLLYYVFSNIDKSVVVQDPQDYLIVLWQSGWILILLIWFILATFYFHFLFSGILRKEESVLYKIFLSLIYYNLFLSIFIFFSDILFYHWEIFYPEKMFDFQPDLLLWFLHYKDEYKDILWLFIFILSLYAFLFFGKDNYLILIKNNSLFRFIPFSIFLFYSLYLFGGESFWRDLWLCFWAFISGEFFLLTKIYFEILKRYKV